MTTTTKPLADRERALEEAFFRKVDADLLDKLRMRLQEEKNIERLAADTGIHDHDVLKELLDLGINPENLLALWLVPLTQVAWADGHVEYEERQAVLEALHKHGYSENSPAWHLLESWLSREPSEDVKAAWLDYAHALVAEAGEKRVILLKHELLNRAGEVARAAGGVFGIHPVSAAETKVLDEIREAMTTS